MWNLVWAGVLDCTNHRIHGRNITHLISGPHWRFGLYLRINGRNTTQSISGLEVAFRFYLPLDHRQKHHQFNICAVRFQDLLTMGSMEGTPPTWYPVLEVFQIELTTGSMEGTPPPTWYLGWADVSDCTVHTAGPIEGTPHTWCLLWTEVSDCTYHWIAGWITTNLIFGLSWCFKFSFVKPCSRVLKSGFFYFVGF
jgi:hypothetical protein